MKSRIAELISDVMVVSRFQEVMGSRISAAEEAANIAEHLIANGVTIIPEGAIILTRAELDALKVYGKKGKAKK